MEVTSQNFFVLTAVLNNFKVLFTSGKKRKGRGRRGKEGGKG